MKTLLVTGGSRGIGAAIALKAAERFDRIIVHYNEHGADAEQLCESI
jgi:NAD(P)-dependent dehydrogenase (short-subunit alcohol dehydrogenase family)